MTEWLMGGLTVRQDELPQAKTTRDLHNYI